MIENKLSTKVWPHKDKIHNGIFSLILPNANRLDIVTVILFLLYVILLGHGNGLLCLFVHK